MAVNKGVWGIDIGQCALKALRLELIEGKPTATAFDYVEHTKILSQPDADPDALIREALEKFLARNDVKNDEIAVGIAGSSGLARFVKLPPVEEKKIAEIVKFEAKQQIPFPLDEVIWDYQKIAGGGAVDGFALETEIGLFAMKRDIIARYLGYFNSTKTDIHLIQMSPLALVNFATYELINPPATGEDGQPTNPEEEENPTPRGKKRCTVVMDVGTEASNLIITDGGKIIWQRPIPLGGNNFTRALTKELKLTFAKAEHLKRNAAKSPDMANILKAIKPVLTDFVGEVQRSLGYFTNTHRDAHVAYMVGMGSAFKLPGLQKYLSDKLALEVKKPTKFEKLAGDTVLTDPLFQENILTFPIAYGLALQGLGLARLTTNLLPKEIIQDRLIRAKKPYAAAAAAALLLGLGGLAMGFSGPYAAFQDPAIKKSIDQSKNAVSAADKQKSELDSVFQAKEAKLTAADNLRAGQKFRYNWPRFLEVMAAALPRPGADGNLNLEGEASKPNKDIEPFSQVKLWQGELDAGKKAIEWFKRRMRRGVPLEESLQDATSVHPKALAMVNVEAVRTRYVTDINAFLQAADTAVQQYYRFSIAEWMKDDEREPDSAKEGRYKPKGPASPGWIVEIRGYTDYDTPSVPGAIFVRRALVRNLQRMDEFAELTDPDAKTGGKINRYIPGMQDPVKGRVSHAFVFAVFAPIHDPQPNEFYNINRGSFLDALVGGNTPSGNYPGGYDPASPGGFDEYDDGDRGGGFGSPPPGSPPSGSPPGGGATGSVPGVGGPATGLPGAGTGTSAALGPAWQDLSTLLRKRGSGPVQSLAGVIPPKKEEFITSNRRRYEFVVMLVWQEPNENTPLPVAEGAPGNASPSPANPNQ